MKLLFVISILGVSFQLASGQELVQKKHIVYNTIIKDLNGKEYKGYIATMNDSTIFMSAQKFSMTFEDLNLNNFQKYGYAEIDKVSLKTYGKMKRSLLIGGISGILVGSIVGYSSVSANPKPTTGFEIDLIKVTQGQATLIGAVIGAGVGCLAGAIIGGISNKVFKIKGKKQHLFEMKDTMIGELY
jgi:hypothetical protein